MPPRHTRPSTDAHRRLIHEEAVALLAGDHGPDVTIDGVAHALSTSRRQLQRAFEESGGTTFSDHLAGVRMRHAAWLLLRTRESVAAVSETVGYREPSQFRKTFKRHYGMSPSALRDRGRLPAADL